MEQKEDMDTIVHRDNLETLMDAEDQATQECTANEKCHTANSAFSPNTAPNTVPNTAPNTVPNTAPNTAPHPQQYKHPQQDLMEEQDEADKAKDTVCPNEVVWVIMELLESAIARLYASKRKSREISLAITKMDEAFMWLERDYNIQTCNDMKL